MVNETKIKARIALQESINALNFLSERVYFAEVGPDGELARLLVKKFPEVSEEYHIMCNVMPVKHLQELVDTIVRYLKYEKEKEP